MQNPNTETNPIPQMPFVWCAFQSVRDGVKMVVPFAKPRKVYSLNKDIFQSWK